VAEVKGKGTETSKPRSVSQSPTKKPTI
jgi:hypothetical protein